MSKLFKTANEIVKALEENPVLAKELKNCVESEEHLLDMLGLYIDQRIIEQKDEEIERLGECLSTAEGVIDSLSDDLVTFENMPIDKVIARRLS